ncbi:MAG: 6-carboxytetrahydropterin synthase QueD [Bacillota bacterium]
MFELSIKRRFAAAHRLEGYKGRCASLHGHTWTVEVVVEGKRLDSCGMLIDFKVLKEMVDGIVTELDHSCLNDIDYFTGGETKTNPTAENLAVYVFGKVKEQLKNNSPDITLRGVRIWESPDASAYYRGDR